MPLTSKGEEIKSAMEEQYGKEKGESVFYASKNAGTITGVDQVPLDPDLLRIAEEAKQQNIVQEIYEEQAERNRSRGGNMDDKPEDCATDAAEEDERTCDEPETEDQMATAGTSTSGTPSSAAPVMTDEGMVMTPEPDTMFEHPQNHPNASTPPEMANDAGVYGGIVGGLTDWGKDCFHDNIAAPGPPTVNTMESPGTPVITPDELVAQSRRYWEQME